MLPILIETGVEGPIGAGRHECGTERLNWRDGYRERTLGTRLGSLNLLKSQSSGGDRTFLPFCRPARSRKRRSWRGVDRWSVDKAEDCMGCSPPFILILFRDWFDSKESLDLSEGPCHIGLITMKRKSGKEKPRAKSIRKKRSASKPAKCRSVASGPAAWTWCWF
jgi:hypothetical protein